MRVQGSILVERRPPVVAVPVSAIQRGDSGPFVTARRWLRGKERRPVELGRRDGAWVEVESGSTRASRCSPTRHEGRSGRGRRGSASRALAVVAGLLLAAVVRRTPAPVPTYEVVPRDFTHRVTAEGFLRPTEVTLVQVPTEAPPGGAILWRADDGIQVEAGEVVALLDRAEMEQKGQEGGGRPGVGAGAPTTRRGSKVKLGSTSVASRQHEAELELDHAERFRRVDRDLYSRREILQSEIDEQLARVRQDQAGELQELHRDLAATELVLVDVDRRRAAGRGAPREDGSSTPSRSRRRAPAS